MINKIIDKANYATFLGLILGLIGIQMCFKEKIGIAIILLILCGICDGFDGYLARKLRKSTDEIDKRFGIEIDSICDIVNFGVFPIVIVTAMGFNSTIDIIIYALFIVCGACRLAYYNSVEAGDCFEGVPITFSAILLPLLYLVTKCEYVYIACMAILAILYVTKIKIRKLDLKEKILFTVLGIVSIILLCLMIIK